LSSTISKEEYDNVKNTGELDLFDLRRDPQYLVINKKSVTEADILSRAKDDGYLTKFTDIRRPYNTSESNSDFVAKDSAGSKIDIDVKAFDGSGKRPYHLQTEDIIEVIKNEFNHVEDPNNVRVICDIALALLFYHKKIYNNITEALDSNELNKVDFLFD
jgi:hypothetical protein